MLPLHIAVSSAPTIDHLDPNSAVYARHKAAAAAERARIAAKRESTLPPVHSGALKFPCLEGGLLLGPTCAPITPSEHRTLLRRLAKECSYYLRSELRSDGRVRLRRRRTRGLRSLAVTFRPDFAAFLSAHSSTRAGAEAVRSFVIRSARDLAQAFAAETGCPVAAIEVHPESGVLHMHLTYTSVDEKHRLRWPPNGPGRRGIRTVGAWHLGMLRLARAGYIPAGEAELAVRDLARVVSKHGQEAVDWSLAQTLDARCEQFIQSNGLEPEFVPHARAYAAGVAERRARLPKNLRNELETATQARDHAFRQIQTLKGQLQSVAQSTSAVIRNHLPRNHKPIIRSL